MLIRLAVELCLIFATCTCLRFQYPLQLFFFSLKYPLEGVVAKSLESCLILCNPMGCNLPGSSVHGIFQGRILKWIAVLSSREVFLTQGSTHVSCTSCTCFLQSLLPCPPSGSGHPHPHISPDTRMIQGPRAPWSLREEGAGLQSTQILEQGAVCWN